MTEGSNMITIDSTTGYLINNEEEWNIKNFNQSEINNFCYNQLSKNIMNEDIDMSFDSFNQSPTSSNESVDRYIKSSGRKRSILPNDIDEEERRKKFLERNRVAAYKCRQKKKNWVKDLEEKADIQSTKNEKLRKSVSQLKEESMYLRNLLLTHGNCQCESVQAYLRKTSIEISSGLTPFINNLIQKPSENIDYFN